jgi:hypothetical protein
VTNAEQQQTAEQQQSQAAEVAAAQSASAATAAKKSSQQQLQAITMARSRRSSIQFRNEAVLPDRVLAHYGSETKDVRVGWHAVCE